MVARACTTFRSFRREIVDLMKAKTAILAKQRAKM